MTTVTWFLIVVLSVGSIEIPFKSKLACGVALAAVQSATVRSQGQVASLQQLGARVSCEQREKQ